MACLLPLTLLLTGLLACAGKGGPVVADSGTGSDGGGLLDSGGDGGGDLDTAPPPVRWTGTATVQVLDATGVAVAGAWVMQGGAADEAWALTDEGGLATVEVGDDGITDRYLLAGGEGWISGGTDLEETQAPPDPVVVTITPLPTTDNPDYRFQRGGDGSSPDTTYCGHCHNSIADDWVASDHHEAARNPHTWDLYTGSADLPSPGDCAALGGWLDEGAVGGSPGATTTRCYTGAGVLPLLNTGCGTPGELPCDRAEAAAARTALGSCGDCHAPATDDALPGAVDLALSSGVGWDEGVTCDLCHKIQRVQVGTAPGLDGAITLLRPSLPTAVTGQAFDPITFGPYPDVIVPIMKGSYAPGMRNSEFCTGCHEYARSSTEPAVAVDPLRWPTGLPIHETWSEIQAGPYARMGVSCQACHMLALDEESSTYNISERGLVPSMDQGWPRAEGEVRHHDWPGPGAMTPPNLRMRVDWAEAGSGGDTGVPYTTVAITLQNGSAAHAIPTGEPLRQYLLRIEATDAKGQVVLPTAGPTVPDVGGYRLAGTIGEDVSLDGDTLRLRSRSLPPGALQRVRVVRPTETWAEDPGPGTGWFDDLAPQDKGLPLATAVAEARVLSTVHGVVHLDRALETQPGDRVYLGGEDDQAGAPGWLYAKVLVDAQGNRGVAHYRAIDMASDNRIAPGSTVSQAWTLPPQAVAVRVWLVYRRYAAPVAHAYGWSTGDIVQTELVETAP